MPTLSAPRRRRGFARSAALGVLVTGALVAPAASADSATAHASSAPTTASAAPSSSPSPSSTPAHAGTTAPSAKTTGTTGGRTKSLGMPAPSSPDAAASDDQMIAWAIKHGSVAENKAMAKDLGVRYPTDLSILGTTCDKGHAYAAVWGINFGAKDAHYNVTLDGVGYAGLIVRAKSHDYGAIGVPDGRHRLAFVDPATGRVAASTRTSLTCSRVATPAKHTTTSAKPAAKPAKPVVAKPTTTKPARMPGAHTAPTPAKAPAARPVHHTAPTKPARAGGVAGPRVQADLVSTSTRGTQPNGLAVGLMLSAVLGALVVARRIRRA